MGSQLRDLLVSRPRDINVWLCKSSNCNWLFRDKIAIVALHEREANVIVPLNIDTSVSRQASKNFT